MGVVGAKNPKPVLEELLIAGILQPERVAAHTARTALLAWIIAGLEGANQDRAATLALFHDSQEFRSV